MPYQGLHSTTAQLSHVKPAVLKSEKVEIYKRQRFSTVNGNVHPSALWSWPYSKHIIYILEKKQDGKEQKLFMKQPRENEACPK